MIASTITATATVTTKIYILHALCHRAYTQTFANYQAVVAIRDKTYIPTSKAMAVLFRDSTY